MARQLRLEYPGAVYHVMSRANRGEMIFTKDEQRKAWLKCLGEVCEQTGWMIHAYVLMGNHYHLLVETPEGNLCDGMRWFQGTFTNRYNRLNRETGHLYQGRYKSLIVDSGSPEYFRQVSTYIPLNPARARFGEGAFEVVEELSMDQLSLLLDAHMETSGLASLRQGSGK